MYLSTFAKSWLAGRIAGEAITISLHTGAPGDDGTANELATGGGANYARKAVAAAMWTVEADADRADNEGDIEVFTPNAASAGQDVTHVGYWLGADFFGWVALEATVRTVENQAFVLASGTAAFTVSQAA